jgi:hypothetical protein
MRVNAAMAALVLSGGCFVNTMLAADYPQAEIANGRIRAKLYLPNAQTGFYRSTRFDWSGVVASLEFGGHNYYGPWFSKYDPTVRDFIYKDADIVAGAESATMGPADEFQTPLGFDAATAGGRFIKIGVGVLKRPDNSPYSAFKKYEIADSGKWSVKKGADFVEFVQELADPATGFGYIYRKTVRLTAGKPEMIIEHSLKNTGRQPINSNLYNHNFLVLDGTATGPEYVITMPFEVKTSQPANRELAEVRGNRIVYLKTLQDRDTVAMPVEGFGGDAKDYDIRVENRTVGAGMRVTGDHPLASVARWSIRSVLAIEPFITVAVEPGKGMTWKYTYSYYSVAKGN